MLKMQFVVEVEYVNQNNHSDKGKMHRDRKALRDEMTAGMSNACMTRNDTYKVKTIKIMNAKNLEVNP